MSKKITLSIGERLAAVRLFDVFKGKTSELAVLLDDVKKFVISEDEWKKANLVKTPGAPDAQGNPTESWKWEEKGHDKTLEVEKESIDYLLRAIDTKNASGEVTLADVALVTLEKKLKSL